MASFVEARFPVDISYGSGGGPGYNTDIIDLSSGHEIRNVNWSLSRNRYNVSFGVRTQSDLDTVIAFFRSMKGRAFGFRFRDWTDYKLQTETIGTGDGTKTVFQIIKTYTNSLTTYVNNITKIVTDASSTSIGNQIGNTPISWEVRVNSVLQTEGGGNDYTVDRDTGIITFNSAVTNGDAVTVSGEYDVPVRFDQDQIFASIDSFNNNSVNNIILTEVRI